MTESTKKFQSIIVYLRVSSGPQNAGNGLDRQRDAALEEVRKYSKEGAVVEVLQDPGLSAWTGKHITTGVLGKFLDRGRKGGLKGSLFICERVSRASREGAFKFLAMVSELLDLGCALMFVAETQPFDSSNVPPFLVTHLSVLAELAQMESAAKSDFAKDNWARKRHLAETTKRPFTKECPMWLKLVDGAYQPIPDRVASILKIYELARDGWGISRLVRYANIHRLPAPGKKGSWHGSLITRVLTNQALIGRFQPHEKSKKGRAPIGEPIEDYYPIVIDPDLFYAVQAQRARAIPFPNRKDDNNFNYLMGLGHCECGGSWRRMNKNSGAQAGYAQYGCSNRPRGDTTCANVQARAFDFQFIAFACQSIPEMLATGMDPSENRRASLDARLHELDARLKSQLDFIEAHADLAHEVGTRIREIRKARSLLEQELGESLKNSAPAPGFDFGDAVSLFLPAYLDYYPPATEDAEDAFRARALFTSRVLHAISAIVVAVDRRSFTVRLTNGVESTHELDPSLKFGKANLVLDDEDLGEVKRERKRTFVASRLINNGRSSTGASKDV